MSPALRPVAPLRRAWLAGTVLALAALGGCASLQTLDSEVASYGEWPAGRQAGSYRTERLPSQAARAEAQQRLEAAATPALAAAGFRPASDPASAEVVVQLAARESRQDPYWVEGWWWRGPAVAWRVGPAWGPRWSPFALDDRPRVEREVAVLIRDARSGTPLYEARAGSQGNRSADDAVLAAMFTAALKGFPQARPTPTAVAVPLTR